MTDAEEVAILKLIETEILTSKDYDLHTYNDEAETVLARIYAEVY